jgi:hypothetical protein
MIAGPSRMAGICRGIAVRAQDSAEGVAVGISPSSMLQVRAQR